ncbi:Gfo/Idh/MocA family protein [Bacillus sp. 7884-1]|uniref:Gfo/Idh/MocA family protein n=1 Tax=Bacillus sp. 7884-1 TaxID=2021693 RepID=UPI000BA4FEFC|nr:Gfo/Idh/MocA family oxidoreductase [Bacillus sp. 7884-1]PAE36312.1 oxidoreductase [Bacillus sp. 7884-1]
MNHKKVKVALIGAGGWGFQHARILRDRSDVEFCAIVGRSLGKTRERANEFGTNYYLSIEEMLKKEKPDIVCLCLPNQDHFEPTLKVIKAGYPLIVEKPLVFKMEEARTLINEAEKRNLFFAINFNHRYARTVKLAKKAISEGKLGEIIFASWRFGGEGISDHPFANLIETQCHGFDMLEYLCGPIQSVMAEMTNKTGKGYSTLSLSLKFSNGAVGSFLGTYDSSYMYSGTHHLEINGTKGRILIKDTVREFTYQTAGNEIAEVWRAGYFNDYDRDFHKTFDEHMEVILSAFKNGEHPPVHASCGVRALKLAYAAIESFKKGIRVETL